MKRGLIVSLTLVFIVSFFTMITAGTGTKAAKMGYEVCREDIKTLCKETEPGEGRIIQCMEENKEKLSTNCRKVHDVTYAFFKACGPDAKKYCPKVRPGHGRIFTCLNSNKDRLSEQCVNFFKEMKKSDNSVKMN